MYWISLSLHPSSHTPQARRDSVRPVVAQRVRFCLMRTAWAAGCDPALALWQLRRGPFGTCAAMVILYMYVALQHVALVAQTGSTLRTSQKGSEAV